MWRHAHKTDSLKAENLSYTCIIFICSDLQKQTLHFTIYDVAFNLSLTLATTLDQKSGPIKYQIYTPGTITTIQMYCSVQ